MRWDLTATDLDFFDVAPYRFVSTEVVHRPIDAVFAAIAADPAGWGIWYPFFTSTGRYLTPPPHGPASTRQVTCAGIHFTETILAWEEPHHWAFTVTESSVPLARRLAEDYRISSHGAYSVVQWTFAIEPREPLTSLMKGGHLILPRLFRRAMTNLSVHLSEPAHR